MTFHLLAFIAFCHWSCIPRMESNIWKIYILMTFAHLLNPLCEVHVTKHRYTVYMQIQHFSPRLQTSRLNLSLKHLISVIYGKLVTSIIKSACKTDLNLVCLKHFLYKILNLHIAPDPLIALFGTAWKENSHLALNKRCLLSLVSLLAKRAVLLKGWWW